MKDNNCDGQIDEGVLLTFFRDSDGDGYGDPLNTTQACSKPSGYVENSDDCDDTRQDVYPGAVTVCTDDYDNNCDGSPEDWVYVDQDGDNWAPDSISQCSEMIPFPEGMTLVSLAEGTTDCDDTRSEFCFNLCEHSFVSRSDNCRE